MRVNESSFLRQWAGTSMIPALLVWGMRHGEFSPDGAPMGALDVAEQTGYSVEQVYQMCRLIDSMQVKAFNNEVADIVRSDAWWRPIP